ncbi:MAG: class II fumarate hydratase [Gemmatimonadetes bacterium]|nr:class II fumarate hydratase [Gemmatimonadota bacterium]
MAEEFRIERDSLGEMKVPARALWGAQTQRAVENFPISDLRLPRRFLVALAQIKKAAARTNAELGLLEERTAAAIERAADEVIAGRHDAQFPIDVFQTGSGTSTNMNMNEVIAHRAAELLREEGQEGVRVHPNDHVNLGQSSNDTIPTAMQVAACVAIREALDPALERLETSLERKAREFDHLVKSGRTHLMDATPVRLGQEFGGYAAAIRHARRRLRTAVEDLAELPLGGTAVGTGINTHESFARLAIARLSSMTGIEFREAENHFERQGTRDTVVFAHGALNALAVGLTKIANDIRWLASGPRAGLAEITLPATQPGSSIMPGKVNPVIPEAVTMVAAQIMGNHTTITVGGLGSYFELNVMMPVMAYALLQSIEIAANAARVFAEKCVDGIVANEERLRELLEGNLMLATAMAPKIGYDAAASLAKEAHARRSTVREVAREKALLAEQELDEVLNVREMTEPGIPGGGPMPGGG